MLQDIIVGVCLKQQMLQCGEQVMIVSQHSAVSLVEMQGESFVQLSTACCTTELIIRSWQELLKN